MSRVTLILLSFLEAALLVVVLSVGLFAISSRLKAISSRLGDFGGMLTTVESQHLRGLSKWVADINGPLQTIAGVLPGIAAKAALVVRKTQGG